MPDRFEKKLQLMALNAMVEKRYWTAGIFSGCTNIAWTRYCLQNGCNRAMPILLIFRLKENRHSK